MENIINKEYTADELFQLLDIFMTKYFKYYTTQLIEDKTDCIEHTKIVHEVLTTNFNFLKIYDLIGDFIDEHIDKSNNLDYVILAIDYLFRDDFFHYLLNFDIDMFDDSIKSTFHRGLTMLIMYRDLLYKKYIEENLDDLDMKKYFLEIKLPNIIAIVKNIYDNMCLKTETDEFYVPLKEHLMELLCAFDLEEIYAPDLLE